MIIKVTRSVSRLWLAERVFCRIVRSFLNFKYALVLAKQVEA